MSAGVTWRDVERVRNAHPDWGCAQIARELKCTPPYVRATFQRRGWVNPNTNARGAVSTPAPVRAAAVQVAPRLAVAAQTQPRTEVPRVQQQREPVGDMPPPPRRSAFEKPTPYWLRD